MYKYGSNEVPKDLSKALSWHHRAAEKGNWNSHMALAEMYMIGEGVPKSMEEAKKWFQAAAERGDDAAQFLSGKLTGDKPTQIRYLTLASAQGETGAQCALGKLIIDEPSLIQSEAPMARAIYWFEKAAKRGHQEAQFHLGTCHGSVSSARFHPGSKKHS
jgi:TPR repeat protein